MGASTQALKASCCYCKDSISGCTLGRASGTIIGTGSSFVVIIIISTIEVWIDGCGNTEKEGSNW